MLSIIIGIVIIAVLIFVGIEIKINDTIFSVIFVGVILSSLVIGLFYPAKGFTDWQLVKEKIKYILYDLEDIEINVYEPRQISLYWQVSPRW